MSWNDWTASDWLLPILAIGIPLWMVFEMLVAQRQAGRSLVRNGPNFWWAMAAWLVMLIPSPNAPWLIALSLLGWLGMIGLHMAAGTSSIRENGLLYGSRFIPWQDVRSANWNGGKLVIKGGQPASVVLSFQIPESSREAVIELLQKHQFADATFERSSA